MSQSPAPSPPANRIVGRRWHHQINRWLVLNVSALNAVVFLMICLAGIIFTIRVSALLIETGGDDLLMYYIPAVIFIGLVGCPMAGILLCGLIALLVEIASQSRRTAELLHEKFTPGSAASAPASQKRIVP